MKFESCVYNHGRLFVTTQNWLWIWWNSLILNDLCVTNRSMLFFVNSYNFHEKQWFHMEFESVVYNLWRLFVITQNWIWMLWKPLQLNDISWNWNQSRKHTSAHRNVLGQDVRQVLLLETMFVCSHFGFVKLLWLTVAGLGGADVLARWPADIVAGVRPGPSTGEHCRGACLHLQPPLDRCGLKS